MDKEILFEKLEAYIDGTLPQHEQEEMRADPSLLQEIKLHSDLESFSE